MNKYIKLLIVTFLMSAQTSLPMQINGTEDLAKNAGLAAAGKLMAGLDIAFQKALHGHGSNGEYTGLFPEMHKHMDKTVHMIAGLPAQSAQEEKHEQPGAAAPQVLAQAPQYPAKPLAHGISEVGKQISEGLKNHKLDHKLEFTLKVGPEDGTRLTGACLIPVGAAGCMFGSSCFSTCIGCAACTAGAAAITKPAYVNSLILQAPGLPRKAMNWTEDHYPLGLLSYCGLGGLKLA